MPWAEPVRPPAPPSRTRQKGSPCENTLARAAIPRCHRKVAAASTAPVASRPSALAIAGLAALLLITLADNGATRMYSWPWSLARWAAQIAPIAALGLRGVSRSNVLRLPPAAWLGSWSLVVAGILASAWLSPWRGPSLIGTFTPLAEDGAFFLVYDGVPGR